jgi:hypothetical protein
MKQQVLAHSQDSWKNIMLGDIAAYISDPVRGADVSVDSDLAFDAMHGLASSQAVQQTGFASA